jgi:hypothetical protein
VTLLAALALVLGAGAALADQTPNIEKCNHKLGVLAVVEPQGGWGYLLARISNVKVYAGPSRDSKVVATLARTDELIASGDQKNGFVQVDSSNFSGWVQKTLVGPGH